MAGAQCMASIEPPLGIVLILKDDAAERILFRYPDAIRTIRDGSSFSSSGIIPSSTSTLVLAGVVEPSMRKSEGEAK